MTIYDTSLSDYFIPPLAIFINCGIISLHSVDISNHMLAYPKFSLKLKFSI